MLRGLHFVVLLFLFRHTVVNYYTSTVSVSLKSGNWRVAAEVDGHWGTCLRFGAALEDCSSRIS